MRHPKTIWDRFNDEYGGVSLEDSPLTDESVFRELWVGYRGIVREAIVWLSNTQLRPYTGSCWVHWYPESYNAGARPRIDVRSDLPDRVFMELTQGHVVGDHEYIEYDTGSLAIAFIDAIEAYCSARKKGWKP